MVNVCNIFNPINKTNGNFLLFSQYVEDVSRSVVDSAYRVRPSQFVCMNFDENIQNMAVALTLINGYSPFVGGFVDYIPGFFQNQFENGVASLKNVRDITPLNFSIGFIDKLAELTQNEYINIHSYIKYIGDIDLESWEDGYADIILDINSGAFGKTYKLRDQIGGVSTQDLTHQQFSGLCCDTQVYENTQGTNNNYYISGWVDRDDLPISPLVNPTGYIGVTNTGVWSTDTSVLDQMIEIDPEASPSTEFTFNTILILYDIVDSTGNVYYKGIPMGIYFTGDGNEYGIGNGVTIKNSSETAYGAGSGWSLRICTKFAPTPHGKLQVEEIALESKAINSSISALMSATAEAIKSVKSFAEKSLVDIQTLKELYSNFKNTRTNVPYPREVNEVLYWFVNGRNTEVPCTV